MYISIYAHIHIWQFISLWLLIYLPDYDHLNIHLDEYTIHGGALVCRSSVQEIRPGLFHYSSATLWSPSPLQYWWSTHRLVQDIYTRTLPAPSPQLSVRQLTGTEKLLPLLLLLLVRDENFLMTVKKKNAHVLNVLLLWHSSLDEQTGSDVTHLRPVRPWQLGPEPPQRWPACLCVAAGRTEGRRECPEVSLSSRARPAQWASWWSWEGGQQKHVVRVFKWARSTHKEWSTFLGWSSTILSELLVLDSLQLTCERCREPPAPRCLLAGRSYNPRRPSCSALMTHRPWLCAAGASGRRAAAPKP